MRWLLLNCLLMAGFAILSATNAEGPRNKRDLSLVKKFIKSAIFGSENKTTLAPNQVNNGENVRIFRIPGFDHILVKAIPKVAGAVEIPENVEVVPIRVNDQKVSEVASYLGTQTQAETLKALQGIKVLLSSGILTATTDGQEIVPISSLPPLQLVAAGDRAVERLHIVFDTSSFCDDLQANERPVVIHQTAYWENHPLLSIFQRPISFPSIFKPVNPVKVPAPVLPTKYSYKQIHGDGKVTEYTANDDHNVIVTESDRPVPLPPFVTYRIQEIMKLGANALQGIASVPVFEGHIHKPMVQYFDSPKVNPYLPPTSNYIYKQIHKDGTATSYKSNLKENNIVVSQTGKVPTIPEFITDRIEKVAATTVSGKEPNIDVLSGPYIGQIYWYDQQNHHPKIDIRDGVWVNVDNKEEQKKNVDLKGTYSYQTVHNDGTVTNYLHEASPSKNPLQNANIKPIAPSSIGNRLQTIAQTSGGSFSYKILHSDGSVTNYGVLGVHEGVNGENKIATFEKGSHTFHTHPSQLSKDDSAGSFTYKIIHNDGSVSSYSGASLVEEKGSTNIARGDSFINNNAIDINNLEISTSNKNIGEQGTLRVATTDKQKSSGTETVVNDAGNVYFLNDFKEHFNQQNLNDSPQNLNPSLNSFSYKAIHNDGSVTIYSQNGVSEIKTQEDLDLDKIQNSINDKEAIQQSSNTNTQVNNDKLYSYEQASSQRNVSPVPGSFSYQVVHNDGSVTKYLQNGVKEENIDLKHKDKNQQPLSVTDFHHVTDENKVSSDSFSIKNIHRDGFDNNNSEDGEKIIKVPNENIISTEPVMKFEDTKLHTNPQVIDNPSSSFPDKTALSEGSSIQSIESGSLQQKIQNQHQPSTVIEDSKSNYEHSTTEVIPPAPELPEMSSNVLTASPASIIVTDSNQVLFTKPIISSYTYKQINHNRPNQFTVAVNIDEATVSKESPRVSGQVAGSQTSEDKIPKDYVYIPPATTNEPLPIQPLVPKEEIHINPPSAVVLAPVEEVTCVEKLSEHPIVVLDEPMQYSYEHRKVDGSAMIVKSDQAVVSVTISPKKEHFKRGDIP